MPAIPIIAAVAAVASIGVSLYASSKASEAQQQALGFQKQQADLQGALQKRQAVREARSAYANSQQEAENQGAGATSAAQGAQGSITSQMDSNLSFLDSYDRLSDAAGSAIGRANKFKTLEDQASSVGGLAAQVWGNPQGTKSALASIGIH